MSDDLPAMRRDYRGEPLTEVKLATDWCAQFRRWFDDISAAGNIVEPNAMILATVSARSRPSLRTVLLKEVDERGFVFYTRSTSRKGSEIAGNPAVSLLFPWHEVGRQIIVEGEASPISPAESDAYFASRPYGARIGALTSEQSSVIPSREHLLAAASQWRSRYPPGAAVPRPSTWGGFRVAPRAVEFWQGQPDRLHDRLRYRLAGEDWVLERLAP